jgi:PhzF family phenazine biosynthesis protein
MRIRLFQIDAFTDNLFRGNPAAVCPLDGWLDDSTLQAIAAENNLSETAFFVKGDQQYELRWFTPKTEVDLCGHATLASAHVIFHFLDPAMDMVQFRTKSGLLTVKRQGNLLAMEFPARPPVPCGAPVSLVEALGVLPKECLLSRDYLVVFESEEIVRSIAPEMNKLATLDCLGVIVSAPGTRSDFVSRFFAPRVGVPEDPVTGSAHCTLIPYWADKLGKKKLHSLQLSERGGELFCEHLEDRVLIGGRAVVYLDGFINIGQPQLFLTGPNVL